jgi:hypothetical protein
MQQQSSIDLNIITSILSNHIQQNSLEDNNMVRRIIILICISLCFFSKAITQYSFENVNVFKTNDKFTPIFTPTDSLKDTVKSVVLKDQIIAKSYPCYILIPEEVGLGTLMGVGFSLPCGIIASKISGEKGWGGITAGAVGLSGGLLVGYSYGIYLAAKSENRNISFLGTFASEIIGAGIGFGINVVSNHKGVGRWTPIILPLSFPVLYVELYK